MPMNPSVAQHIFIRGSSVVLRSLRESDLDMVREWRNQPRVRSQLFDSSEISDETHRAWWAKYCESYDDTVFIIETLEGRPIGTVSLYRIDRVKGTAEIGRMMIGPNDCLRKGYMQEAMVLALADAVVRYGLRMTYLWVRIDNDPAINLYRSQGFLVNRRESDRTGMILVLDHSEEVQVSLTLYVRERVRTVKQFLDSLNKNSCWTGHEVLIVADPEWTNPCDSDYVGIRPDGSSEDIISLKDWFDLNVARYDRLRFKVVDTWKAECWRNREAKQKLINVCTGFNHAIRTALSTEYVVTSMACDMYWTPNWDVNLMKWAGAGDILVPHYLEPHVTQLGENARFTKDGVAERYYLGPAPFAEQALLDAIERHSLRPREAVFESPRHRYWIHAICMTMTRETFDRAGRFLELPHPESTDLYFDDAAGKAGLLKVGPLDSFAVHGPDLVVLDPEIHGGPSGRWYFPKRGRASRSTIDTEAMQKWRLGHLSVMPCPLALSRPLYPSSYAGIP